MAYFFILVRVVSRQSVSLFERAKSNQKPAEKPMVLGLSFDSHPGLRSLPSLVFRGATGLCQAAKLPVEQIIRLKKNLQN
jgi:hypothetical protein